MTHQTQTNAYENLLELVVEHGFDRMAEAMTILLNEAMKLERTKVLGAAPYERSEHRVGYANGYKQKTVACRFEQMPPHISVLSRTAPWWASSKQATKSLRELR